MILAADGTCPIDLRAETSTSLSEAAEDLVRIPLESCVYRGEGNSNIVVALLPEHKVIRFRKRDPSEGPTDGGKRRARREVEFQEKVVSNFLGCYIEVPRILRICPRDKAKLLEAIRPFRPERRRDQEIVEEYATEYLDYTFLPFASRFNEETTASNSTFCVEIKPKQGYVPKRDRQFQMCPYCLAQYYKLKKGAIRNRSNYCPMDLFSGERERMRRAVHGLLEAPQNNLKIFKDGIVVYDHDSYPENIERIFAEWFQGSRFGSNEQYVDKFVNLVCEALLYPFPRNTRPSGPIIEPRIEMLHRHDTLPRFRQEIVAKARQMISFAGKSCDLKGGELPEGSVLERILRMQQLPYCSADVVYQAYNKYFATLSKEAIYSDIMEMYWSGEDTPSLPKNMVLCNNCTDVDDDNILTESDEMISSQRILSSKSSKGDVNRNQRKWPTSSETYNEMEVTDASHTPCFETTLNSCRCSNNNIKANSQSNSEILDFTVNGIPSLDECLALQNYLFSVTAKDCSILISFKELEPSACERVPDVHIVRLLDGDTFMVKVAVVDLDPKQVHCIRRHHQRDVNILNAAIQALETEVESRKLISLEKLRVEQ
ncbi:inositol-pentakisphosphate 2-kinase isoform X2 [Orussus abietinus]|uniref:inositol-pentakisphosphate 2-kinase isoform X2 n=1 Tax=Orussus abietinus TaxID=222816 RepID=UPI0006256A74|nr:inositol-pentakisphosphate 2-kinase isoform X2 [Orussus abietinus]